LAHFINTKTNYLRDIVATGNGQPNLNTTLIGNFKIPLPPTKAEQAAIAEVLSDADAFIESLDQLLTKKRRLKQGAMQELLTGKKRLPGFSSDWEETTLGQLGECLRGVSYNPTVDLSPFDKDSTVRLLRSNNVQEARVVFADMQFVNCGRVSADQRLRPSDILICMANGSRDLVGKAGRFSADDGFGYTFGAFMGCFRPNGQTADPDFVFFLFQTEAYRAHISILLAGSSINNLTPGSVEALVIGVPPDRAEQTAVAAILSDMDGEIAALEAKLAKARSLKQGMMQELLTGKVRLV
jgi:type I restriction enzyme S subunit